MKKYFLVLTISILLFVACKSSQTNMNTTDALDGTWQLNYITGPRIAFDGLYPDKKPTIVFDIKENKISGNNSCNQYLGKLIMDGNKIN